MRFLIIVLFSLSFSFAFGQTNTKGINPFVSQKEKYWLKKHDIDLYNVTFNNELFIQNIRHSIALNELYTKETSKFGACLAGGIFGIIVGVAVPRKTTRSALLNIAIGGVGIGFSIAAFSLNKKRKKTNQALLKQLDSTQSQYNLLRGK